MGVLRPLGIWGHLQGESLSGGITASRYLRPSSGREFEFEWGYYGLSVSEAIFRARVWVWVGVLRPLGIWGHLQGESLSLSGGITASRCLRPSSGREFEFEWGYYGLSVSEAIFRARVWVWVGVLRPLGVWGHLQGESLSLSGGITASRYLRPSSGREFEFEWGYYGLSVSEAIFRARVWVSVGVLRPLGIWGHLQGESLSFSGGITPSRYLRPSSGREFEFQWGYYGLSVSEAIFRARVWVWVGVLRPLGVWGHLQGESLSLSGGITASRYLRPSSGREFEFEWGYYDLSVSEAIFRARVWVWVGVLRPLGVWGHLQGESLSLSGGITASRYLRPSSGREFEFQWGYYGLSVSEAIFRARVWVSVAGLLRPLGVWGHLQGESLSFSGGITASRCLRPSSGREFEFQWRYYSLSVSEAIFRARVWVSVGVLRPLGIWGHLQGKSLSFSGGITASRYLRPSSGREFEFEWGYYGLSVSEAIFRARVWVSVGVLRPLGIWGHLQGESLSLSGGITASRCLRPSSGREFEFQWGYYGLSVSEAIFRARTYSRITYSVVWWWLLDEWN